jgi:hypothetical protein
MICPNCRNQIADNVDFCSGCGTNIKDLGKMVEQPTVPQAIPVVNTTPVNNFNNFTQYNNVGSNKSKRYLLIILGLLVVVIIGICLF